jgi:putative methionine-R-sulfoxide reductase with GAF domain
MLGSTPAELLLLRSTSDIERITHAGLLVAVGSTLFTTLSLSGLNMIVIWSIRRPIHRLAGAARAVAQGELDQEVQLAHHPLAIGEGDEIGLLAESLNQITADLRDLHANLEAKVQARTAAATTEAEIARVISSSLESDVILRRSAALIKKRLELHHVGIFLVESGSDTVVLEVTSSQGSEAAPVPECSRREKVQVPLGSKSPVGLAAATGRPQVIQDVRLQPTHLKPPLLIDTYSATAIPLLIGESQVGVLDLQSKQPGTFTPEVIHLLSRLADQIAAGVSNARLYAQQCRAAAHLAEVDRLRTQFLVVVSQRLRLLLCALSRVSEAVPIAGNDGPLTGELKRDLQVILDSCHQLLTLIDDISDSSQIYADKIAQTLDDVDVVRVRLDSVEAGEGMHADRIR